jgi:predicted DCC family thiol-disulfide oxidoreductase YuxK
MTPRQLTVLYDAGCGICRTARTWLAGRAQLVPLEFVPAGSAEAVERYPDLDHARTLTEITVIADTGDVYEGDAAWLICLWALEGYRSVANRLATPALRPLARGVVAKAAAIRAGRRETGDSDWFLRPAVPPTAGPVQCETGTCDR